MPPWSWNSLFGGMKSPKATGQPVQQKSSSASKSSPVVSFRPGVQAAQQKGWGIFKAPLTSFNSFQSKTNSVRAAGNAIGNRSFNFWGQSIKLPQRVYGPALPARKLPYAPADAKIKNLPELRTGWVRSLYFSQKYETGLFTNYLRAKGTPAGFFADVYKKNLTDNELGDTNTSDTNTWGWRAYFDPTAFLKREFFKEFNSNLDLPVEERSILFEQWMMNLLPEAGIADENQLKFQNMSLGQIASMLKRGLELQNDENYNEIIQTLDEYLSIEADATNAYVRYLRRTDPAKAERMEAILKILSSGEQGIISDGTITDVYRDSALDAMGRMFWPNLSQEERDEKLSAYSDVSTAEMLSMIELWNIERGGEVSETRRSPIDIEGKIGVTIPNPWDILRTFNSVMNERKENLNEIYNQFDLRSDYKFWIESTFSNDQIKQLAELTKDPTALDWGDVGSILGLAAVPILAVTPWPDEFVGLKVIFEDLNTVGTKLTQIDAGFDLAGGIISGNSQAVGDSVLSFLFTLNNYSSAFSSIYGVGTGAIPRTIDAVTYAFSQHLSVPERGMEALALIASTGFIGNKFLTREEVDYLREQGYRIEIISKAELQQKITQLEAKIQAYDTQIQNIPPTEAHTMYDYEHGNPPLTQFTREQTDSRRELSYWQEYSQFYYGK